VQHFITAVDEVGHIYSRRWGDASIRWLQLALFAKPGSVFEFCNFDYEHFSPMEACSGSVMNVKGWRHILQNRADYCVCASYPHAGASIYPFVSPIPPLPVHPTHHLLCGMRCVACYLLHPTVFAARR
jgi:hypothetical protein